MIGFKPFGPDEVFQDAATENGIVLFINKYNRFPWDIPVIGISHVLNHSSQFNLVEFAFCESFDGFLSTNFHTMHIRCAFQRIFKNAYAETLVLKICGLLPFSIHLYKIIWYNGVTGTSHSRGAEPDKSKGQVLWSEQDSIGIHC